MTSNKAECAIEATHHSADRVAVYHGTTEPLTVCGYHNFRYTLPELLAGVTRQALARTAFDRAVATATEAYTEATRKAGK